jgi:hypothetical protein
LSDASAYTTEARVATPHASRYLQQLCKHFAHKLPETAFDATAGRIPFPFGDCTLDASEPDVLVLRATAAGIDDLAKLQDVVARHLERFAFREPLTLTWRP